MGEPVGRWGRVVIGPSAWPVPEAERAATRALLAEGIRVGRGWGAWHVGATVEWRGEPWRVLDLHAAADEPEGCALVLVSPDLSLVAPWARTAECSPVEGGWRARRRPRTGAARRARGR